MLRMPRAASSSRIHGMRLLLPNILFVLLGSALALGEPASKIAMTDGAIQEHVDVVGPAASRGSLAQTMSVDTIWIAEWDFDGMTDCDTQGWEGVDLRVLNDGQIYWSVSSAYQGMGNVLGQAAIVGGENPCWPQGNGYCNDWYQGIRIEYQGETFLSFDYLLDSEPEYDFLRVEVDSACSSFERLNYAVNPRPSTIYRQILFSADGLEIQGRVDSLQLPDFGNLAETHCAYIAFFSDFTYAPCDGKVTTQIEAAAVVDHIEMTGGTVLSEDFEGPLNPSVTFFNMHDSEPFGQWARLYQHPTDPQPCVENTTCAWIWTDHTTPTFALDPSMAFGPGGYVVRHWLDNAIVSPWVSLTSTPEGLATLVEYQLFRGNPYSGSRIHGFLDVRSKKEVGETECVSAWSRAFTNTLNGMHWDTIVLDLSTDFDPSSDLIQIRHRVTDTQYLVGYDPPLLFNPGPGPYIDRTRIGRIVASGPSVQESDLCGGSSQAQDRFASEPNPAFPPSVGERFRPSTDRFGTADFSMSFQIERYPTDLIIGDSIAVRVEDVRHTGGVNSVDWYGTIVSGPHTGKAPPPWTIGPNGFFQVPATNSVREWYFIDLDEDYFRGGDVLVYFWLAEDALGGVSSFPFGLNAVPASITEAEAATGGLLEVSFLPTISWSPSYLARIATDPNGKLEPTPEELSASEQARRILYCQMVNPMRRTGDANRTSFMYTLDRLGYREHYDVFDHMGLIPCSYNNPHLAGRASVEQATGYGLIVFDAGTIRYDVIPDDRQMSFNYPVDQAGWFRDWLSQGASSEAGYATLWLLGENIIEEQLGDERPPTPHVLYTDFLGVDLLDASQSTHSSPDVAGLQSYTFFTPDGPSTADFTGDVHSVKGGCPEPRDFDAMLATGTAVTTHRYKNPVTSGLGSAALVMNSDPVAGWSTIVQSHPWFDIREASSGPVQGAERSVRTVLAAKILAGVLPARDQRLENPTDVSEDDPTRATPMRTALYANVPNPFNPPTTIRFDLAERGHVSLHVFNVAGRLVRTLLDQEMPAGWNHRVFWDGLDRQGRPVSSGIYFYRLEASDFVDNRKMVVLK